MKGYIHSLQSLGTVDGPGVRAVVFASGCPLRCVYCHNPDTWHIGDGVQTDAKDLAEKILRLYPYIKDGGVTFSGGEPTLQPKFFSLLAELLKAHSLHIALDTCGYALNEDVKRLLENVDLVLLDLKFTSEEDYKRYTGGSLKDTVRFLDYCQTVNKSVWIRHVVVPNLNDSEDDILKLRDIIAPYTCIENVELLPFKKLCVEKYKDLNIHFPLCDTEECQKDKIDELYMLLQAKTLPKQSKKT